MLRLVPLERGAELVLVVVDERLCRVDVEVLRGTGEIVFELDEGDLDMVSIAAVLVLLRAAADEARCDERVGTSAACTARAA